MYHFFVRKQIAKLLDRINSGDFEYVIDQFAPSFEHWFIGDSHALGGSRHRKDSLVLWYKRLGDLFKNFHFDCRRILIDGPPWNTQVALELYESSVDRGGKIMNNNVVLLITISWGRAQSLRVYCDTEKLIKNLNTLSTQGVAAAQASPIVDFKEVK